MKRSTISPSQKPMKRTRMKSSNSNKGKPTATEREWMAFVADFGCVACWWQVGLKTPCAVHHIVEGGRRLGHLMTIGLCDPGHHQNSPTAEKISRHPNKAQFEQAYGTEYEMHAFLLARFNAMKGIA